MRVTIEREECTMCAVCWDLCPDVFKENAEDGYSQIVEGFQVNNHLDEGEVPDDLEACVREAEEGCPVEIIVVE